jgi:hypothetical protein
MRKKIEITKVQLLAIRPAPKRKDAPLSVMRRTPLNLPDKMVQVKIMLREAKNHLPRTMRK